jgi:hypothetical protein
MAVSATRADVLGFRVRAQQLDRVGGSVSGLGDTAVLDIGVQDTGPDGGLWALAVRGVDVGALSADRLVTAWTLRGAPHLYRRDDLPMVAAAVRPFSDADAAKRIYDAAKPLREAGIGSLEAIETAAATMREVVTAAMVKGEVSTAMTARMEPPYLRFCRPCNATHMYEQVFRLAALPAGLELAPGTSPPVLRPAPGFRPAQGKSPGRPPRPSPRYDVVRAYLRLLGPATPQHVAGYLEAPLQDVKERWPADATEVDVDGEKRWLLEDDVDRLQPAPSDLVRLLGPYDLFLQARDRRLLVADRERAKALWPVLGRPGAVVAAGEVAGMWRPRKSGSRLTLQVTLLTRATARLRRAVEEQADRLAAYRGVRLTGVDLTG